MFEAVFLFMVVLVAAFVALAVVVGVSAGKRRKAFLQKRWYDASRHGWHPVPPNPWLAEVVAKLYQRGRAGEMIAGDFRGRGMCALDYSYTTSSTGANGQTTSTTHHVHAVALNLPVALPPLTLTKDSGAKRFLAGRDLELESHAFNERFRIGCADDRYASAVLHPRMMEWMLYNPGLEWQFAGNALVSWGTGPYLIPDVVARLEAMSRLIELIPPFVLRDYGRPAYWPA
ncbi:hypothetical protein GCM10009789_84190 [Kribbella sancticallisti]|uniref:DUF3137 domain-containing protein n=1 Tax=Kribbella sancticallisti TaxID=460087 RepID=A0ABN2EUW0_9ACTN